MDRIALRDVNWIGDGDARSCGRRRARDFRAGALDPRAAAGMVARGDGGYEVELVAGEEGVSPGQACVFYDAPSGQARVLGGGFIQSATAKGALPTASAAAQPLVEAMRG